MKNNFKTAAVLYISMFTIMISAMPDKKYAPSDYAKIDAERISEQYRDSVIRVKKEIAERDSIFDLAVSIIKKYEGWHSAKHYPYVGYGHQLLKNDTFDHNISEEFATNLLKKDLLQKCSVFREFGKDSLILGVLAYNIGEYKIKGGYGYKESELVKKLKAGDRDIFDNYTSHCKWKGKTISSIKRRRIEEFEKLFYD